MSDDFTISWCRCTQISIALPKGWLLLALAPPIRSDLNNYFPSTNGTITAPMPYVPRLNGLGSLPRVRCSISALA